jgi:hypothetical protein
MFPYKLMWQYQYERNLTYISIGGLMEVNVIQGTTADMDISPTAVPQPSENDSLQSLDGNLVEELDLDFDRETLSDFLALIHRT